ncbi:MAG: L-threonine 3-dehydrogenase [Alphaproteobacteria bacterium]|nr:L-threonine 3-dehydrogenase [Alphaproteobacteria bacterium]
MRALVKAKAERGIWMEEGPVPEIGPEDVLVKVHKTGICGTDIHIYNWDEWAQKTVPVPMITGHEYAGEIAAVGAEVKNLRIGQRVSGEGHVVGMNSRASRAGKFHLDPDTKGIGVNLPGAFAEFVKIPAFNIIPLPDSIDDEMGAILDPLGNAVHTALAFNIVGEDVLVTGAGPIGIMAAMVARRAGARSVVLTDRNDFRLGLAAKMADVCTVNVTREDLKSVMAEEGIEDGFGVALEMSGAQAAIAQCITHLAMGGRLAMLGIPSKAMEVNWSDIILKAITVKGVYGRQMFETWRKMLALLHAGLDLTPLITHRVAANDYQAGFDAALSGESGKVVMDWS